eukprot:scaffold7485_cov248-Pinguiococcus_pyrenoidosus.AAC.1
MFQLFMALWLLPGGCGLSTLAYKPSSTALQRSQVLFQHVPALSGVLFAAPSDFPALWLT